MRYAALLEIAGRVNDVLNAKSILSWDARTQMPPGGAETRAKQEATLAVIAHGMVFHDATRSVIDKAEIEVAGRPNDSVEKTIVAQVREAVDYHRRIPAELLQKRTELGSAGQAVWAKARAVSPSLRSAWAVKTNNSCSAADLVRAQHKSELRA